MSTRHVRVDIKPSEFLAGHEDIHLLDLNSTNGTTVNGKKIDRCQLKPNDVIEIGWNRFKLIDDSEAGRQTAAFIGRA